MGSARLFRSRTLIRVAVAFFFGLITGMVVMILWTGQKMDRLYVERYALDYANNQKNKETLRLQEELDKDARRQESSEEIQKIQVEVISSLRYGQEEIKTQVESLVEPFIGKSVTWISNNPDLLDTILRNRTVFLSDDNNRKTEIRLQLKYIAFIDSTLKIWVEAEEKAEADESSNKTGEIVKDSTHPRKSQSTFFWYYRAGGRFLKGGFTMIINRKILAQEKLENLKRGYSAYAETEEVARLIQRGLAHLNLNVYIDRTPLGWWFIPEKSNQTAL